MKGSKSVLSFTRAKPAHAGRRKKDGHLSMQGLCRPIENGSQALAPAQIALMY